MGDIPSVLVGNLRHGRIGTERDAAPLFPRSFLEVVKECFGVTKSATVKAAKTAHPAVFFY